MVLGECDALRSALVFNNRRLQGRGRALDNAKLPHVLKQLSASHRATCRKAEGCQAALRAALERLEGQVGRRGGCTIGRPRDGFLRVRLDG
jgi:hypothetical protein